MLGKAGSCGGCSGKRKQQAPVSLSLSGELIPECRNGPPPANLSIDSNCHPLRRLVDRNQRVSPGGMEHKLPQTATQSAGARSRACSIKIKPRPQLNARRSVHRSGISKRPHTLQVLPQYQAHSRANSRHLRKVPVQQALSLSTLFG